VTENPPEADGGRWPDERKVGEAWGVNVLWLHWLRSRYKVRSSSNTYGQWAFHPADVALVTEQIADGTIPRRHAKTVLDAVVNLVGPVRDSTRRRRDLRRAARGLELFAGPGTPLHQDDLTERCLRLVALTKALTRRRRQGLTEDDVLNYLQYVRLSLARFIAEQPLPPPVEPPDPAKPSDGPWMPSPLPANWDEVPALERTSRASVPAIRTGEATPEPNDWWLPIGILVLMLLIYLVFLR
jgi:hypothetical protein